MRLIRYARLSLVVSAAVVDILREYALFFALPVSTLGIAAGSIVGRQR